MLKTVFFFLLCLAALVHGQDQSGFISIDCGLRDNSTYIDSTTGLYYVSDAEYLNTGNGVSKTIATQYQTNGLDQQFILLRSFPQGTKNCYTLTPPRVADRKRFFVRARFLYGNYDSKNRIPTFDLYLGTDFWVTIRLTDVSSPSTEEILYVPSDASASMFVCLVDTGYGTPFISALEIRLVNDDIYKAGTDSLQLYSRNDMRAYDNKQIIRYKDDVFDRIWSPSFLQRNVQELTTTMHISDTFCQVPSTVMQTAITPLNASDPIKFYWEPSEPIGYYLYMHFADFQSNLTREFNITINDDFTWYSNLRPPYMSSITIQSTEAQKPRVRVNFALVKTEQSELPPILNAIELYTVRQFSYQLTDKEDLNAIEEIKAMYGLKKDWQGDPCLPAIYSWEGLGCHNISAYDDPRVISLDLSSNELTGKISPSIFKLKKLQSLDLSNNSLNGEVPDFLSELLELKILILSGNNLSGTIPAKLVERKNKGLLKLSVEGNPYLCESGQCVTNRNSTAPPPPPPPPPSPPKKSKMLYIIIAAVVGVIVVILIIIGVVFIIKKKKSAQKQVLIESQTVSTLSVGNTSNSTAGVGAFKMTQQQFTYSDVVRITDNFQWELGKGGFGAVYHGYIDQMQVAVKMLSSTSNQGYKQFRAEAELLTRVHHRNLTTLVGYCDEGDKQGLIYEYMAKSDLRSHLSERNVNVLSWARRLNIALDAAQGLEYLHTGCKPPIIHRDIKSTNILLNDEYQAKLADFGLSKVFPKEGESLTSTRFAGTPGYLDPEYNINEKSDVFSFGIVLLEIITGRPPLSKYPERVYLYKWVDHMIKTNGDIINVVDPRLNNEFDINSMWNVVDLALECVSNTNTRPSMNQVVIELKRSLATENGRLQPGYETNNYDSIEISSLNIDATGINPSAR